MPFKLKPPPPPSENDVKRSVLQYLAYDRRVAWAERFNVGAHAVENIDRKGQKNRYWIKYAFAGCSDILGQMADGRFLAIELKKRGEEPDDNQRAFLKKVNENNGVAFVARSVADVIEELGK